MPKIRLAVSVTINPTKRAYGAIITLVGVVTVSTVLTVS